MFMDLFYRKKKYLTSSALEWEMLASKLYSSTPWFFLISPALLLLNNE